MYEKILSQNSFIVFLISFKFSIFRKRSTYISISEKISSQNDTYKLQLIILIFTHPPIIFSVNFEFLTSRKHEMPNQKEAYKSPLITIFQNKQRKQ